MRILSLGTYPVSEPRHGGQIRAHAIQASLRNAGHEVCHLAFYRADEYPEEPPARWNITFTWSFINTLIDAGQRTDVSASDFLIYDGRTRQHVIELITEFSPDVVVLEQPWLWPAWKLLVREVPAFDRAKIVYSSQNVEYTLLQKSVAPGAPIVPEEVVDLVRWMETDLVRSADLVVAVSQSDVDVLSSFSTNVVLAPNGIWPRVEPSGGDFWRTELGSHRTALFVGSAHPPNATGFVELLGPSFGYLAVDETIVVVGGVCNLLTRDKVFKRHLGLNLARSKLFGVQDPGGLSTLLEMADIILVPITVGGGTNIKMAEALYNRKAILCTSKAMRGYDQFLDFPFVFIRNTPEEYQEALVGLLRGHIKVDFKISRAQANLLDELIWSSTLKPVTSAVSMLA